MKAKKHEDRVNNIMPIWTMLGLALTACGGGGGGGGRPYLVITDANGQLITTDANGITGILTSATGLFEGEELTFINNGLGNARLIFDKFDLYSDFIETDEILDLGQTVGEDNGDITFHYNVLNDDPAVFIAPVDIVDSKTIRVYDQHGYGYIVEIVGQDADDFEFEADGQDAKLVSVNNIDFETPTDSSLDNVYEFYLKATTPSLEGTNVDFVQRIDIRIEVINDDIEVTEGNIFILNLEALGISEATIAGDDADDVEIEEISDGNLRLVFRNAPDYDNPADANADNIYEFMITDTTTSTEFDLDVTVVAL